MLLPFLLMALAGSPDSRLVLRDPSAAIIEHIVQVGPQGVTAPGTPHPRIIPWNLVRRIEGPLAEQAGPHLRAGDDLWRALARIARGDLPSAESILESLPSDMATTQGPTAQVVWLAMARCRLERGAHTAAAAAWLEWLAVRSPDEPSPDAPPGPWALHLSPESAVLSPHLPPIWVNVPSVAVAAGAGARPWAPRMDDRIDEPARLADTMRAWYLQAARGACELPTGPWPEHAENPDVHLVAAVVLAQHGDAPERHQAREQLRSLIRPDTAPWIESWCRVAVGRSLLKEPDAETRRLGVVELLHVPARLESAVPYLTGVALADAAAGLRSLGDQQGAAILRDELLKRFSGHPSLESSQVRDWSAPAGAMPRPGSLGSGSPSEGPP